MPRLTRHVVAAAASVLLIGCAAEPADVRADLSHLTGDQADDAVDAVDAEGDEGDEVRTIDEVSGASVVLPDVVEPEPIEHTAGDGTVDARFWGSGDTTWAAWFGVYDVAETGFDLNDGLDDAARSLEMIVADRGAIAIDGHDGLVGDLEDPEGRIFRLAVVHVGDHAYQVAAGAPGDALTDLTVTFDDLVASVDIP